jgi:hypothetical protein
MGLQWSWFEITFMQDRLFRPASALVGRKRAKTGCDCTVAALFRADIGVG